MLVLTFGVAASALALNPGERVDNFRLLDQNGASHELYYLSDAKAVVIMVHGNGCPIVRNTVPELKEIRDRYRSQGVEFLLINPNLQDDRDAVARETAEFGIDFPVLVDETQLIGESLGVMRTADVFVIDPKNWKLVYRGPVDDRLAYGTQRPRRPETLPHRCTRRDAGRKAGRGRAGRGNGLHREFPGARPSRCTHAKISYSGRIAPLLADRCASCHRDGGVAPWAMTSYDKVRGFAPMIREVIRTKRMPPWHADPHYGSFVGDRSIGNEDAKTLVHWIEAGAPRGKGPDPLAALDTKWSEWTLGKPDLIVEVPPYDVPATGVVSYQYPVANNPLGRDVWIRAIEILPGNRSVVHHVLAGIDDPGNGERRAIRGQIGELGGYAPGKNAALYPADTGVFLRKEANFRFQMHYTPNGKAITDVTRVGYYFYDKPPKHALEMAMILDTSLEIPANAKIALAVARTGLRPRRDALQPAAARAPARARRAIHRALSGRKPGDLAVGAEIRLQLAAPVCAEPVEADASRHPCRARHDLGQFRAEPGQSRSHPGGALGRPDLGRNERRLVPFPRGRR